MFAKFFPEKIFTFSQKSLRHATLLHESSSVLVQFKAWYFCSQHKIFSILDDPSSSLSWSARVSLSQVVTFGTLDLEILFVDSWKFLPGPRPHWFERGVKKAIYIKVNNPLNKDGGRYKLPGVYEPILGSSVPKVTGGGGGHDCLNLNFRQNFP